MSGGYKKNQYFTALDAAGSLTIQGGTKGTGTLSVLAGNTDPGSNDKPGDNTDLTMAPQTSGSSPDYKITEGANGTWTQNSGGTLRFAANGDLSKFTGVQVVLRKKREHR